MVLKKRREKHERSEIYPLSNYISIFFCGYCVLSLESYQIKKIYLEIFKKTRKKDIEYRCTFVYSTKWIIYNKLASRMIPAQVSEMFLFRKVDNRVC